MKNRSQANTLKTGDRITVENMWSRFELVADPSEEQDGFIRLQLRPCKCGPQCSDTCGCSYLLFRDQSLPLEVRIEATKRLPFHGNLAKLEEFKRHVDAQIKAFKSGENGSHNAEGLPEERTR